MSTSSSDSAMRDDQAFRPRRHVGVIAHVRDRGDHREKVKDGQSSGDCRRGATNAANAHGVDSCAKIEVRPPIKTERALSEARCASRGRYSKKQASLELCVMEGAIWPIRPMTI